MTRHNRIAAESSRDQGPPVDEGLSHAEMEAEAGTPLPAREAMSTIPTSVMEPGALLDVAVDLAAALDLAAPIQAAVAANAQAALPIDAAVSANALSGGAVSLGDTNQVSIVQQALQADANATGNQDSAINQGEGGGDAITDAGGQTGVDEADPVIDTADPTMDAIAPVDTADAAMPVPGTDTPEMIVEETAPVAEAIPLAEATAPVAEATAPVEDAVMQTTAAAEPIADAPAEPIADAPVETVADAPVETVDEAVPVDDAVMQTTAAEPAADVVPETVPADAEQAQSRGMSEIARSAPGAMGDIASAKGLEHAAAHTTTQEG